ncbi:outer membrane protein assembly factor BamC [Marinobacter confluentis]|uniref:Outer membrane protein assembly factor BamC n=1 Tax=Marinobacter confluentis TaxID=1697557 RepID=A0A4Z1BFH2_9GAMM|nr:outer membrane protein assembly factor BamC [Marinobacter confluentis]TGN41484.1 outer membrane protein assembly factor BamC [Marinobacter confluentis]
MAFTLRTETPTPGKLIGPLVGLMFVLTAAGCGVIEDRTERYVDAPEGTPIEFPESADTSRFSQRMPIRTITAADAGRMFVGELPEPPDMTSEILEENYVIEVVDDEIWLLVNDVPGRLWPAVTAYMNQQGLGVAFESPQLGLLQSELVNYSKQARELLGMPHSPEGEEPLLAVQAKVAPGVRRKTTEIQLRPFNAGGGDVDRLVAWETNADRTAQELETSRQLLSDLSEFLKNREDSKSYSQAALGMPVEPLVRLVSENEVAQRIEMKLDYGRSWGEVRRALDEAGIAITDLNREAGYFFVDARPQSDREAGWFSWFSDEPEPEHTHDLTMEQQGDRIIVTAARAEDYTGDDRSAALLSELFEYLY